MPTTSSSPRLTLVKHQIKDLQQIRNKKYYEKNKTNSETTKGAKNLSDQLQIISSMSIDEPSIRMVKTDKNFRVVIFGENQINDVQRFCCSGKTVLGVDKTFNLGEVFVTASTFKNLASSNEPTVRRLAYIFRPHVLTRLINF